jgi:hypothetical protein
MKLKCPSFHTVCHCENDHELTLTRLMFHFSSRHNPLIQIMEISQREARSNHFASEAGGVPRGGGGERCRTHTVISVEAHSIT